MASKKTVGPTVDTSTPYPNAEYQAQSDNILSDFHTVAEFDKTVLEKSKYTPLAPGKITDGEMTALETANFNFKKNYNVSAPTGYDKPSDITDDQWSHFLELVNSRSELDQKLRELYATDTSQIADSLFYVDRTILSGILWSVLATYTFYYIFIRRVG